MSSATIALLGQPNSGKSTLFNALTGLRQHVGNWPGKTVEKKEVFSIREWSVPLLIFQVPIVLRPILMRN